jgi:hypothetical protein
MMKGFGFQLDLERGITRKWYVGEDGRKRWHDDDSFVSGGLPFDVARCKGVGDDKEGWREGCEGCLRRTSPGHTERQVYMNPPEVIVFECEFLIE